MWELWRLTRGKSTGEISLFSIPFSELGEKVAGMFKIEKPWQLLFYHSGVSLERDEALLCLVPCIGFSFAVPHLPIGP